MIRIYVFGHPDSDYDSAAITVADHFKEEAEIEFVEIFPNNDLPVADPLYIMDAIEGLSEVELVTERDIDKIIPPPRGSVHDFDLGFQLKYLIKLGKIKRFQLIGLPMGSPINYERIHSILRKLVAQDIQGS